VPNAVVLWHRSVRTGVAQNADYGRAIGRGGRLAASVLDEEDRCE
jgi:hypothetical protein